MTVKCSILVCVLVVAILGVASCDYGHSPGISAERHTGVMQVWDISSGKRPTDVSLEKLVNDVNRPLTKHGTVLELTKYSKDRIPSHTALMVSGELAGDMSLVLELRGPSRCTVEQEFAGGVPALEVAQSIAAALTGEGCAATAFPFKTQGMILLKGEWMASESRSRRDLDIAVVELIFHGDLNEAEGNVVGLLFGDPRDKMIRFFLVDSTTVCGAQAKAGYECLEETLPGWVNAVFLQRVHLYDHRGTYNSLLPSHEIGHVLLDAGGHTTGRGLMHTPVLYEELPKDLHQCMLLASGPHADRILLSSGSGPPDLLTLRRKECLERLDAKFSYETTFGSFCGTALSRLTSDVGLNIAGWVFEGNSSDPVEHYPVLVCWLKTLSDQSLQRVWLGALGQHRSIVERNSLSSSAVLTAAAGTALGLRGQLPEIERDSEDWVLENVFGLLDRLSWAQTDYSRLESVLERRLYLERHLRDSFSPLTPQPAIDLFSGGGPINVWAMEEWRRLGCAGLFEVMAHLRKTAVWECEESNSNYYRFLEMLSGCGD